MTFLDSAIRLPLDAQTCLNEQMVAANQIRVGTAGWSYKDWEGVFYPPGMSRRKQHPLELIARCFDLVEINTSFYGHIRPNDEDEWLAREGLEAMAATGKFGALLIQFPVSFKNTALNREYLETLLRQFIEYPRAVEVRHSTWNNPETIAYFSERNVSFVNIDQPQIGRSLEPTSHVTSAVGYVRLHGRNYDQWFEAEKSADRYNYLYKPTELAGWKERVETIAEKAKVTFVVANNHFEAKAGVNALQLKHMLTRRRVVATEALLARYPELKNIADPLGPAPHGENLSLLA